MLATKQSRDVRKLFDERPMRNGSVARRQPPRRASAALVRLSGSLFAVQPPDPQLWGKARPLICTCPGLRRRPVLEAVPEFVSLYDYKKTPLLATQSLVAQRCSFCRRCCAIENPTSFVPCDILAALISSKTCCKQGPKASHAA